MAWAMMSIACRDTQVVTLGLSPPRSSCPLYLIEVVLSVQLQLNVVQTLLQQCGHVLWIWRGCCTPTAISLVSYRLTDVLVSGLDVIPHRNAAASFCCCLSFRHDCACASRTYK